MSGLVTVSSPSATARPAAPAPVNQLARWDATTGFPGVTQGVTTSGNVVRLSKPTSKRRYAKRTWRYGSWTSGWVRPRAGWSFDQVVPSWSATTPKNTFVEIKMRARTTTGAISGWKVMARWASGEWIRRTSSSSQADGVAKVATDTLVAASSPNLDSYEIAVFLHREHDPNALRPCGCSRRSAVAPDPRAAPHLGLA